MPKEETYTNVGQVTHDAKMKSHPYKGEAKDQRDNHRREMKEQANENQREREQEEAVAKEQGSQGDTMQE
jgi:hypothetical protein